MPFVGIFGDCVGEYVCGKPSALFIWAGVVGVVGVSDAVQKYLPKAEGEPCVFKFFWRHQEAHPIDEKPMERSEDTRLQAMPQVQEYFAFAEDQGWAHRMLPVLWESI